MTPVVTCWSQWCSTPPRCQSIPATVQPDGTTGVCQASSGSPSTIFSTESRWYCRKPRSMRDSSSWFTSPTAGDAVSGVVTESAMVPVFRVGRSHPSTAQAPRTHRGNAAYRLLVRGGLLWPGRCDAVRSRPPPGEARTCPARCDHKAGRPDPATARLALRLTILPPGLPPNGTGRRLGGRSRAEGKRAGQTGHGRDLSARLELGPHLSGNDTPALTWDFAYELNSGPSPCTGRGLRLGRRKTRLTCGAPLRNRTVDLLLTMDHQTVPVSAAEALSRQNTSSR